MDREKLRKGLLAKVHIAKKDLGLTDADYRAMLDARFGVESAARLAVRDLEVLVDQLQDQGWQPAKAKAKARPRGDARPQTPGREELQAKVHALLAELGRLSGEYVPFSYAESILQRQSKVERLGWATPTQLRGVVAALDRRVKQLTARAERQGLAGQKRQEGQA